MLWRDHSLRGETQNFTHLFIPIGPDMTTWDLPVLVRNLPFQQKVDEGSIGLKPRVGQTTVNTDRRNISP